jgi:hypothetical protein
VRGQQAIFETAKQWDLPVAFIIAGVCVGVATALLNFLGFWGLIVAPVAGGGVAEIVRGAVRRRRSRRLPLAAALGGAAGLLPLVVIPLAGMAFFRGFSLEVIGATAGALLWPLASGALMIGALYARLRGIRI